MLPLLTAGMGLATEVPEIIKMIQARKQLKLADQLSKTPRPTYNIPTSEVEALNNARNAYQNHSLPGEANMQGQIQANSAGAARGVMQGDPENILAGLSAIQGNENNAQNNLNDMAAQYHDKMQQEYNQQLNTNAGYQDQAFQYNQDAPYEANMRAASALKQAGLTNQMSALSGTAGVLNQVGSSLINQNQYDNYLATGGGSGDKKLSPPAPIPTANFQQTPETGVDTSLYAKGEPAWLNVLKQYYK